MKKATAVALGAAFLAGCAAPLHMGYDHGRAFTETFSMQGDLTRASIVSTEYPLYGNEAADIRLNVREATTAEKEGDSEFTVESTN